MENIETSKEFNPDTDAAWYVIGCLAGRDNKVYETLSAKMKNGKWDDVFFDVVFPHEEEIKERVLKNGTVKITKKIHNLYAGYTFVNCIMTDELWYEIRNTPGVSGIIGSHGKGSKPTPMLEEEVRHMLRLAGRDIPIEESQLSFKLDDEVRIVEGPFANKTGKLIALDINKKIATVQLIVFNKSMDMKVDIHSIEKA